MKSYTRNDSGVIELLIVFPLFIGLISMIAWIGFLLIQKTKIEKNGWLIQTQKTYQQPSHPMEMNADYKIQTNPSFSHSWSRFKNIRLDLPKTFNAFLNSHLTEFKNLEIKSQSPIVIQYFYSTAFDHKNIRPYQISAELMIPGEPMTHATMIRQGILYEAMLKAGFNYPLDWLGIPELAGIPTKYIGGFGDIKIKNK